MTGTRIERELSCWKGFVVTANVNMSLEMEEFKVRSLVQCACAEFILANLAPNQRQRILVMKILPSDEKHVP